MWLQAVLIDEKTSAYLNELKQYKEINLIQFGSSLKICKVVASNADIYPRLVYHGMDTCCTPSLVKQRRNDKDEWLLFKIQ